MNVHNLDLNVNTIMKDYPEVYKGMVEGTVSVRTLHSGHIYKFADKKGPFEEKLSSGWWWSQESFDSIRKIMRIDPENASEIVRRLAGIKYEWSNVDEWIVASVGHSIKVFEGEGRMQLEVTRSKSQILYSPPESLLQMYIPGLRLQDAPMLSSLGRSVITNPVLKPLASRDDLQQYMSGFRGGTMVLMNANFTFH